jgi:hypothetical protein
MQLHLKQPLQQLHPYEFYVNFASIDSDFLFPDMDEYFQDTST